MCFVGRWTESSIRKNVRKELRAFFADYAHEFFARLDVLSETKPNHYIIHHQVFDRLSQLWLPLL